MEIRRYIAEVEHAPSGARSGVAREGTVRCNCWRREEGATLARMPLIDGVREEGWRRESQRRVGRRAQVAACWWTGGKQARPGPESEAALGPARVFDLRLEGGGGY